MPTYSQDFIEVAALNPLASVASWSNYSCDGWGVPGGGGSSAPKAGPGIWRKSPGPKAWG